MNFYTCIRKILKKLIRKIENLENKLVNARVAIVFNKICLNENLLPTFTNIYIYINYIVLRYPSTRQSWQSDGLHAESEVSGSNTELDYYFLNRNQFYITSGHPIENQGRSAGETGRLGQRWQIIGALQVKVATVTRVTYSNCRKLLWSSNEHGLLLPSTGFQVHCHQRIFRCTVSSPAAKIIWH